MPVRSMTAPVLLSLLLSQPLLAQQDRSAVPAAPAAPTAAPPAPGPLAFEQLDGDADRVLTLEEVPEQSTLFRDFARWDANKDGVLNVPEFNRYVDQLAQL